MGSKKHTETYVASYSYPLFDADNRLNSYLSAMLDYTSNSQIEHSEYMKNYYTPARFRNYRSYLNWWDNSGNDKVFGKIQARFYGDPTVDNVSVANVIRPYVSFREGATNFAVYSTSLNFFSEDAWIRHLATQQGKEAWIYQPDEYAYTISYPTDSSIKATFTRIPENQKEEYPDSSTWIIQGALPTYTPNSRFLEIGYSYLTVTEKDEVTIVDGKTVVIHYTVYKDYYGYMDYQEGSGIPYLDSIIANSGTVAAGTFFPVIPIRTNTAWYSGDKAIRINNTLRFLEIYDSLKNRADPYSALKNTLTSNIQGSLGDIDYMTLLHGVTLNSSNQSDLQYIYTFFLNLHINEALSRGEDPLTVWNPRSTYVGSNFFGAFVENTVHKWHINEGGKKSWFRRGDIGSSFHHHLNITCASSNLNYDYHWAMSEYFEANGKFRPDAKVNDYGVLTGSFVYTWTTMEPDTDAEGNVITHWDEDTQTSVVSYHEEEHSIPFTFTLFCHQESEDRWRFTLYVCLELTNHIYAGKSIITTAYEAITDNSQVSSVTHDFTNDFAYDQLYYDEIAKVKKYREGWSWKRIFRFLDHEILSPEEQVANDFRAANPAKWLKLTFKYGTGLPDATSPFIVPFELNTYNEVGARIQMDITNGGLFLICNCWVQVTYKKRWYQRGVFKFVGFVFQAVGAVIRFWWPAVGNALMVVGTVLVAVTVGTKVLNLAKKVLGAIFGEKIGAWIYSIIKIVAFILVAVFAPYALPFVVGYVSACETYAQTGSLSKALGMGIVSGISTYIGQQAFYFAGDLVSGVEGSTASNMNSAIQGAYDSADGFFLGISDSVKIGMDTMGQTMQAIANNPMAVGALAGGMALSGLAQGLGSSLINGGSFKDALRAGLTQGAIAGISTLVSVGGTKLLTEAFTSAEDKLLQELSHAYYTEENIVQGEELLGGLANINYGVMQDTTFFEQVSGLISKRLLNMNSVMEYVNQSQEAKYARKLARLKSDFDEFNNAYQSAMDVLNTLKAQTTSTVNAEYVAKMQASIGRLLTMFPESMGSLSVDNFLSFATTTEIPLSCTASVSTYVEDMLSINGTYAPDTLYYNQQYLSWAMDED